MYIIQSEYYVSTKALKEIHEELVRQAKEGVMILPCNFKLVGVAEDQSVEVIGAQSEIPVGFSD